jgi:hypothetical protein
VIDRAAPTRSVDPASSGSGAALDRQSFGACRVLIVGLSLACTEPFPRFRSATCVQRWRITADRFGFDVSHETGDFAVLVRDDAVLHLWGATDGDWRSRDDLGRHPICSGAESFLAGTASCRIEVSDVDTLFAELQSAGVLHDVSLAGVTTTDFGTREFATLDSDGNLLTLFRLERHLGRTRSNRGSVTAIASLACGDRGRSGRRAPAPEAAGGALTSRQKQRRGPARDDESRSRRIGSG